MAEINDIIWLDRGWKNKNKVKAGLGELKQKVNGMWKVDKYSRWKD
jgi:hypothetical protein